MTELSKRFSFDQATRKILVHAGKVEIGQHIHSAFQTIVADTLKINKAHVLVAAVNTQSSPDDGMTVGSLSIQVTGAALREAALALHIILVEQAAQCLQTDIEHVVLNPDTLKFHADKQSCSMFDLPFVRDLAVVSMDHDSFSVNATSTIAASIRGERHYIQDLVLPGMVVARALRSRVVTPDNQNIKVIKDGGFSALVADTEAALEHTWSLLDTKPAARDSSCDGPVENWIHQRQTLTQTTGDTAAVEGAIRQTATRGFLLHASIAPSCAIARFSHGVLEVWTHSQGLFPLRDTLARILGNRVDEIILRHVPSAGCYGHSAADDAVMDAVLVCLQLEGTPVRVTWTRQDDFQHAPVGAPMHVQIDAKLTVDNTIDVWRQTIWSGPHGQRPGGAGNINLLAAIDQDSQNKSTTLPDLPDALGGGATRNATPPYSIGSLGVTSHIVQDLPVRTSSIRGLGAHINVVCIEAAIDQLANRCAMDPLEFRLKNMIDPRGREVLHSLRSTLAATATASLQDNEAIGIAYSRYKEKAAYAAVAARVRLTENVELLEVWAVVDAGQIVERSGALNQIEGGIIQAASWTLCEGALLRDGAIDAADWDDYPIMDWAGIPDIHTSLIGEQNDSPPLGVGECMVGPVSAAIVNAVSKVAGCSMANLPLTAEKFLQAASGSSDAGN